MTSGQVPPLGTHRTDRRDDPRIAPGIAPAIDWVGGFATAAERFARTVGQVDLGARVPGCPGWTAYDLVVHVGNIHAWAATIVETGRAAPDQDDQPRSRRGRVVEEWYAGKAGDLYEVLRSVDPDRPCWNFADGEGRAGFWRRRQLHETTVHQIDLDAAAGRTTGVPVPLAEDGVDEVLRVMAPRRHRLGEVAALDGPVTLVSADSGRAWTVAPRPDGPPAVTDGHGPDPRPDAVEVSGPAGLLYRVLWKRAPHDGLRVGGGPEARARAAAYLSSPLTP